MFDKNIGVYRIKKSKFQSQTRDSFGYDIGRINQIVSVTTFIMAGFCLLSPAGVGVALPLAVFGALQYSLGALVRAKSTTIHKFSVINVDGTLDDDGTPDNLKFFRRLRVYANPINLFKGVMRFDV